MIQNLTVRSFKSLSNISMEFPRLTILFGPNAEGKSNLLDAIQALSRIGTERTLMDALGGQMIRGYPIEAFALPVGGIPELLSKSTARFSISADLAIPDGRKIRKNRYRYRIEVEIASKSGALANCDEYLSALSTTGNEKGVPAIEVEPEHERLKIRRQSGGGRPRFEDLNQNYAILSDPRLGSPAHKYIERVREELLGWRTYYLDPRLAMRRASPPLDVFDIGVFGEYIAAFLYRLKAERRKNFESVVRTVQSIIPSVEAFDIDLDERRGILDINVQQNGTNYSSRVVSEGTLRVLALCAISANPWSGSLLAFEEPENGVHPRRIELIAKMLTAMAVEQERQVVVTTHSPLFCDAVLKEARGRPHGDIALYNVRRVGRETQIQRFDPPIELLDQPDIMSNLTSKTEDGIFEFMVMRGWLNE